MLRIVLPVLLLFFGSVAGTFPDSSRTLRIATWNLWWLSSKPGKGKIRRGLEDYAALQRYAEKLDADIIAIQETDGIEAANRVFNPDRYNIEMSRRTGGQAVGFAIRKGVPYVRNPDLAAMGLGRPGLRWAVDISVAGASGHFRLLCVHLKSGCFTGQLTRSKACRVLNQQLPLLENWIDARFSEGEPFAVLGDFNRQLKTDDPFWKDLNDDDPPGLQLIRVTEGKVQHCNNGKYPDFIDHIILGGAGGAIPSITGFSEYFYDPEEAGRLKLSDHCPVVAEIKIPAF